jgi:amino acid transporter
MKYAIMAGKDTGTPRLRRSLTLWDLILYGIIVIQPTAPMSVFGVLSERGRGHVVTTLLIAMIAMLFTAISYGRMARAYPSAGSAFTYVSQEIHPALGYITGWSMAMDYMLNPLICIIWCSKAWVQAPKLTKPFISSDRESGAERNRNQSGSLSYLSVG